MTQPTTHKAKSLDGGKWVPNRVSARFKLFFSSRYGRPTHPSGNYTRLPSSPLRIDICLQYVYTPRQLKSASLARLLCACPISRDSRPSSWSEVESRDLTPPQRLLTHNRALLGFLNHRQRHTQAIDSATRRWLHSHPGVHHYF